MKAKALFSAMSRALFGVCRTGNSAFGALSLTPKSGSCEQRRTIVVKELLKLPENYPEPWDYRNRSYDLRHMFFDWTKKRLHQNSKLIVVEGNIGSGKSEIAEEIADKLGFYYMRPFKMDDVLIDRYGNDMRDFYHLFPKRFRTPDANLYYKNPDDDLSAVFQDRMYFCRHEQYMNAVAHILNTGQGVVLENSVYGDFVFANAMRKKDFIGPEYFQHYYYVRRQSLGPLMVFPHLFIYLDAPIDKCLETIKKRGNTDEINVCDTEYLETIAKSYTDLLADMKQHSYILAYDCAKDDVNADTIIEDVTSKLDFEFYEWHSGDVMQKWFLLENEAHCTRFRRYITGKDYPRARSFEDIRTHEVGELYINPQDAEHFTYVMQKEVLKDYKNYGFTKRDSVLNSMMIWQNSGTPEKWFEYFYREMYYNNIFSVNVILDPYAYCYNPDYLSGHHH